MAREKTGNDDIDFEKKLWQAADKMRNSNVMKGLE